MTRNTPTTATTAIGRLSHHLSRRHITELAAGTLMAFAPILMVGAVSQADTGAAPGQADRNEQVAVTNDGEQLEFESALNGTAPVTSHDGAMIVFSTDAPLVARDTNHTWDVYLRDTNDDMTVLVSGKAGRAGNDISTEPSISANGRYVAFTTWATNLTRDTNGSVLDVVVRDMHTGEIRVVSLGADGAQRGRNSFLPVISGNGRFVSFQSFARLSHTDLDSREDVYVRDLSKGMTIHGSRLPNGKDVPFSVLNGDLSDSGQLLTFGDSNRLFVRNLAKRVTTRVWAEPNRPPCQPYPMGSAGRPTLSGNGRYLAFSSCATELPRHSNEYADIYLVELSSGDIRRVTPARNDGNSFLPSLSRTGRYLGFGSESSTYWPEDTNSPDAFVMDLNEGSLWRASVAPDGAPGNALSASAAASISGDGRSFAYVSYANNLVEGDAFDLEEAFVWRNR